MAIIIPGVTGLFFLYLGLMLLKKHRKFFHNSIQLQGSITDIIEFNPSNKVTVGKNRDLTPKTYPLVQYRYNGKNYQFQSDTDISPIVMPVGSLVTVLIEPMRPKAPKLEMGMKNGTILFRLFTALGLICLFVAGIIFEPTNFIEDITSDPFEIVMSLIFLLFAFFGLIPMLKEGNRSAIYPECAKEIE